MQAYQEDRERLAAAYRAADVEPRPVDRGEPADRPKPDGRLSPGGSDPVEPIRRVPKVLRAWTMGSEPMSASRRRSDRSGP